MRGTILALGLLAAGGGLAEDLASSRVVVDREGRREVLPLEAPGANPSARHPRDTTDRTENGSLDDLAGQRLRAWSTLSAYPYGLGTGAFTWVPEDAQGRPGSGSLLITNTSPAEGPYEYGVQQCLRPSRPKGSPEGTPFPTRLALRVPPGQNVGPHSSAGALVVFFDGEDCSGGFVGGGGITTPLSSAGTEGWQILNPDWLYGLNLVDDSLGSAMLTVEIYKSPGVTDPIQVLFDDIQVRGTWKPSKGDVNRDGETDLILRHSPSGDNVAWFMHDEARLGAPARFLPSPRSPDWRVAGTDDFDGDGEQDLMLWNARTGELEFWLLDGVERRGEPVPLSGAPPLPWRPAATADFDADARPDIVFHNPASGKLAVWTLQGLAHAGTIVPAPDQASDLNWEIVAARDLNGDGTTDLLWQNASSGRVAFWLMDASVRRLTGAFTNPPQAVDASWQVLAAGDYGLGPSAGQPAVADSVDLVWRNASSGRLVVWFMDRAGNRTGGAFVSPEVTAAGDWTVVGPR